MKNANMTAKQFRKFLEKRLGTCFCQRCENEVSVLYYDKVMAICAHCIVAMSVFELWALVNRRYGKRK